MGFGSHHCRYDGDKVILWNVDLVKPSDATVSSRRVYWICAPWTLPDLYKFDFRSFACVIRTAGDTANRQSYCLSFDYMCWIRGASEIWMEVINCQWGTIIAAMFALLLTSVFNPYRNVGGGDKVRSLRGCMSCNIVSRDFVSFTLFFTNLCTCISVNINADTLKY